MIGSGVRLCVFQSPLFCLFLKLLSLVKVLLSNFAVLRIISFDVSDSFPDHRQQTKNSQSRRPPILQLNHTNSPIYRRYIRMPNLGHKLHLRWFKRIIIRHNNINIEETSFVQSLLWSSNISFPMHKIPINQLYFGTLLLYCLLLWGGYFVFVSCVLFLEAVVHVFVRKNYIYYGY